GTLMTIAKDVKVQIEFNPSEVQSFRLLGYENRVLAHRAFNDDRADAGDIGSDHTVTAFYEIVPPGQGLRAPEVDQLKDRSGGHAVRAPSGELGTVKLRYKAPQGDQSELIQSVVRDDGTTVPTSTDFRFAAAVAEFGLLLRRSPYRENASYEQVLS